MSFRGGELTFPCDIHFPFFHQLLTIARNCKRDIIGENSPQDMEGSATGANLGKDASQVKEKVQWEKIAEDDQTLTAGFLWGSCKQYEGGRSQVYDGMPKRKYDNNTSRSEVNVLWRHARISLTSIDGIEGKRGRGSLTIMCTRTHIYVYVYIYIYIYKLMYVTLSSPASPPHLPGGGGWSRARGFWLCFGSLALPLCFWL